MDLIKFIREVQKLKDIERNGWIIRKVKNPESVLDHSFIVAVLSMLYAKKLNLDAEKSMKLALIHDLGECYTGDIPSRPKESDQPVDNVTKTKLEDESTKKIISLLPSEFRMEFSDLWDELKANKTKEAILVKDLDHIEPIIQLFHYKNRSKNLGEQEWFEVAKRRIKSPEIRTLLNSLMVEYGVE